tara:strand:- start:2459 stop:2824 length:366 start_codon:yes stop_codon:yes gene_type:complete
MTLEILPPGLTTDESAKPASSGKKFDRQEFFPSSLTDGQSEQFRLLGAYGTGHAGVLHTGVLFAVNGLGGYPSWPRFQRRLAWRYSNQERHFASCQSSSAFRKHCCSANAVFIVVLRHLRD